MLDIARLSESSTQYTNKVLSESTGLPAFLTGHQFRTFRRLSIAAGATLVVKASVPVNVILYGLEFTLISGQLDVGTIVGGTEGGTFAESLPIFNRNNMDDVPPYTAQVALTAGGTHSGGVELDVIRLKVADNSNFASSVLGSPQDIRGVATGTYYFRILNDGPTASAEGVLKARWEERP